MKSKTMFISILIAMIITINSILPNGLITNAIAQEEGGWKTLISPEYKFSIEYPADLEAQDSLSGPEPPVVIFMSSGLSSTSEPSILNIHPNNMSLSEFVNYTLENKNRIGTLKLFEEPTPITVANGNPGLYFSTINDFSQALSKHAIFTHGDHIYEFVYIVDNEDFNESQYNHMVESIKFLD